MFCRILCILVALLSIIRTSCQPSLKCDVIRHRAGKYRSDYLLFGVPVCADYLKKAITHSNLGRNRIEDIPSIRFGRSTHQEAVSPVLRLRNHRTGDILLLVGRIGPNLVEYNKWVLHVLWLSEPRSLFFSA